MRDRTKAIVDTGAEIAPHLHRDHADGHGATVTHARLPPEREGHDAPEDLAAMRRGMAAAREAGAWPSAVVPDQVMLRGVRSLRFVPDRAPRGRVIQFHGGGFRIGCPETIAPYVAELVRRCRVEVFCPAYRLAPEHPFPAALADAWSAVSALPRHPAAPLIVSGDSAGGGLAAGVTALLVAHRTPPAGLVLLSPWLDLTLSSSCFERHAASDPLFSRAAAEAARLLYLQGASASDPLVSPLLGPVAGFPPTLVAVGAEEVLGDDGRRLHRLLRAAAIPADLLDIAGMQHVAVMRDLSLTGATETLDAVTAFLNRLPRRPLRAGGGAGQLCRGPARLLSQAAVTAVAGCGTRRT